MHLGIKKRMDSKMPKLMPKVKAKPTVTKTYWHWHLVKAKQMVRGTC